jgi:putative ABC transport system permease protein
MRWHLRLYVALRGLFGWSTLDRELNEELQFHFDRQVQENIDRGLAPGEARRAASIALGNPDPIREASRDGRSGAWLRQFTRDLAFGVRLLIKAPAFSVCAIAIVATGIAAVTAMFSVVYGVLLRPLPFPEPDRLVQIWTRSPRYARDAVSAADRRDWQAETTVFEGIALYNPYANFNLTDGAGDPERLLAARVSANALSVLHVSPKLGRGFIAGEDEAGNERVVILSDALWRRRFGGDPGIVGRQIGLSGIPHEVIGVMAQDFPFPERPFALWVPLTVNPKELTREVPPFGLRSVARLKPGVTIEEARSQLSVAAARIASRYAMNKDVGVEIVGLQDNLVGDVRRALYLMLAAVGALLCVAALNLAALLSARAAMRHREVAVRLALGASKPRVLLQSIAEVIPILAAGGTLGIVAAVAAVRQFLSIAPAALPRLDSIAVDRGVMVVAVAVLSTTGIVAAILPALQAWRTDLASASRNTGRGSSAGPGETRTRFALVIAQIALSVPLMTGAVLLARSFTAVASINPGFNPDRVVSMHLAIPRSKYRDDPQIARFEGRLLERIQQVRGVESAAFVNRLPLFGVAQNAFVEFEEQLEEPMLYGRRVIAADYFTTMGIPLIEGRTFQPGDSGEAPVVAIVDERIAERHWPRQSAIGKRLRFPARGTTGAASAWMEIVGVVGHVKHDALDADSTGQMYFDYRQSTQDRAVIVARVTSDPGAVMASMIAAIREVDPEQPVYDARPLNDVLARSISSRWLSMTLVGGFAGIAVFLCSIGVYGVIASGVAKQRREIGIRLALGASRHRIAASVVTHGLTLAVIGIGAGLVLAFALTRSMTSLLFGVSASDVTSFGVAIVAIFVVALFASYLPARRAAAVDPAVTLRAD